MKINGKQIADKILEDLKIRVNRLRERNTYPNLAIILVGDDPASLAYISQKKLKAEQVGIKTTIVNLKSGIRNSELNVIIKKLNNDDAVHGIIVQRPVLPNISSGKLDQAIDPKKDVDGFHPQSHFQPPISLAVFSLLKNINASPTGKNVVVFGKGETGGQPVIQTLKKMSIEPIVIDSKTKNPENLTKNADIVISAVGKPQIIKSAMLKRGVILISIGLHKEPDGKLHGDYNEEEIKDTASFYTPTPGGVGPVNVAMLLKNVIKASCLI